jgi:exonuclease VII large subunit
METNVFLVVMAGLFALITIISLYYLEKRKWKLKAEQEKRQQLEQSLEESKSELAATLEKLNTEQQLHQQKEQSLEEMREQLKTSTPSSFNSKQATFSLSEEDSDQPKRLQPIEIYSIKSVSNGKVLHIPQGSSKNNMPIIQDDWRNGQNQQWYFQPLGGIDKGYYYIFSVKSKKCLNVSKKSVEDNAEIHQYQCQGSDNQKWKLIPSSDESFTIQCKESGKLLTVSEKQNNIIQHSPDESDNQRWFLNEMK